MSLLIIKIIGLNENRTGRQRGDTIAVDLNFLKGDGIVLGHGVSIQQALANAFILNAEEIAEFVKDKADHELQFTFVHFPLGEPVSLKEDGDGC